MLTVSTLFSAFRSRIWVSWKGERTIVHAALGDGNGEAGSFGGSVCSFVDDRSLEGAGGLIERARLPGKLERGASLSLDIRNFASSAKTFRRFEGWEDDMLENGAPVVKECYNERLEITEQSEYV